MMSIKRFKPKPKPCLGSNGKVQSKRTDPCIKSSDLCESENNTNSLDSDQLGSVDEQLEIQISAKALDLGNSNDSQSVSEYEVKPKADVNERSEICSSIENISNQDPVQEETGRKEVHGEDISISIINTKATTLQNVELNASSQDADDLNQTKLHTKVCFDVMINESAQITQQCGEDESGPCLPTTHIDDICTTTLTSQSMNCSGSEKYKAPKELLNSSLPKTKKIFEEDSHVKENVDKDLLTLTKPEDIECEFRMDDNVKVTVSKPRLRQPAKLPSTIESDIVKQNVIQVQLKVLPKTATTNECEENTSDVNDKNNKAPLDTEGKLVLGKDKKNKKKNFSSIDVPVTSPKSISRRNKTNGDIKKTPSKVLKKKSPALLKKYKKQIPIVTKNLRSHSTQVANESGSKGSLTLKDPVINRHCKSVQILDVKDSDSDNETEQYNSQEPKGMSVSKQKTMSSTIHKPLLPKPIPKVVETRKQSCDGAKEVAPVIEQNSRPKYITTAYGKTCYDMKQKYLNKYGGETPNHEKLTMLDLIFFNPQTNPMPKEQDEQIFTLSKQQKFQSGSDIEIVLEEEMVDDITPIPQLKVDLDGNIVIDSSPLNQNLQENERTKIVLNKHGALPNTHQGEVKLKQSWTHEETIKFYKALHAIGADFSSMSKLFPERSRKILKSKFKREERTNGTLIDKVLTNPGNFNIDALSQELGKDYRASKKFLNNVPEEKSSSPKLERIRKKIRKNVILEMSEMEDTNPPDSQGNEDIPLEYTKNLINDNISLLHSTKKLMKNFDSIMEKNLPNPRKKSTKRIAKQTEDFSSDKPVKKNKKRKLKDRSPNSSGIRNLQAIIADDESLTIDSFDISSPVKENQIMINTNINCNSMNITKSISYDSENFESPIDVNITIEHKPIEPCEDLRNERVEMYLHTDNDSAVSNFSKLGTANICNTHATANENDQQVSEKTVQKETQKMESSHNLVS